MALDAGKPKGAQAMYDLALKDVFGADDSVYKPPSNAPSRFGGPGTAAWEYSTAPALDPTQESAVAGGLKARSTAAWSGI